MKITRLSSSALLRCIALLLASFVITTSTARASTVVMLDDRDLAHSAKVIITGRVERIEPRRTGDAIYSYVTIWVDRVVKGDIRSSTLVIKQLGGSFEGDAMRVNGAPTFEVANRVLLYLNTDGAGALHVSHLSMGYFRIVDDPATGVARVARGADVAELPESRAGKRVTDAATLDAYLAILGETLAQSPSEGARVAFEAQAAPRAVPVEYDPSQQKFTVIRTDNGWSYRWFEADSGASVVYRINPASSPLGRSPVREVESALAAWTAVDTSTVILSQEGTTDACGIRGDGVTAISFGDCRDQMDDPVNCSGVLAIGGISRIRADDIVSYFEREEFHRIVEGDISFNRNFECFLGKSANLAEVMTHEIGHTLGLGHSAESDYETDPALLNAIMFYAAHGKGRGATLGVDDVAAISYVYSTQLRLVTPNVPAGIQGYPYTTRIAVIGGVAPYRFSLTEGDPPSGLSISDDGVISGAPTSEYGYGLRVNVTDAAGATASRTYNISIEPHSPKIYLFSIDGDAGAESHAAIVARGGIRPYVFSLAPGAVLPEGLTLESDGRVVGVPVRASRGKTRIRVTDAAGLADEAEGWVNIDPEEARVVLRTLPVARVGTPYSKRLEFQGGMLPLVVETQPEWIPEGMTLSADGLLSGTPTRVGDSTVGGYVVTADGARTSFNYEFVVNPDAPPVVISSVTLVGAGNKLRVKGSFPPGIVQIVLNGNRPSNQWLNLKFNPSKGTMTLGGGVSAIMHEGENDIIIYVDGVRSDKVFFMLRYGQARKIGAGAADGRRRT